MVELFLRGYGGVPKIFSHDFLAPATSRRQAWSCRLRPHCHLAFEIWVEESKSSRKFTAVRSGGGGVLDATVLTFPLFTPFNQALLILPALLVLSEWTALPRLSRLTFVATVSWPWITSVALLLWRPSLNPASQIPLLPAFMASFVPLILPLLLFTRRHMAYVQVHSRAVS